MPNYHVPYLAVARFSGEDAGSFLQSQLSADILALETGETGLACYCTPRGQVLALLLTGRIEDTYLVAANTSLLPGVLQRLRMYVMRSRVQIEEAPELHVLAGADAPYSFSENGAEPDDSETWRAGELRNGISWLNEGSSEKFIPQMLGFETIGAVSFKKGCYPGQEIVARARYLGKVKRKPLIVETLGVPAVEPGMKVRVRRGETWSDAVVVDRAMTGDDGLVLFTVSSAEPETPAEELEFEGRSYRCATT